MSYLDRSGLERYHAGVKLKIKNLRDIIAEEYDSTAAYTVGDLCVYDGGLYVCTTAIPTAEEWTDAHWTAVTVGEEISDLKGSLNQKYEKPSTGIPASDLATGVIPDVSGKADKVQNATSGNFASLDANGNLTDSGHKHSDYLTEHQDLSDYVKNTDWATGSEGGISIANESYGIGIDSSHRLIIVKPTSAQIKAGTANYRAVVPSTQHESTFYGLAKAAGDTTQSASSNAVGTYTDTAKASIKAMLGIVDSTQTVVVSGTTPTITALTNTRYICGEVSTLTITPPGAGICEVVFTSGSTPTVLTATGVTFPSWFDPTALEADTTYEISISDGKGVVCTWAS